MAGVMELARVFSQFNTEVSIIFVAFSGEEQGLPGSKKYVKTLLAQEATVYFPSADSIAD